MVAKMAPNPLVMALANPTPEIMPDLAMEVRDDMIMATGRSDFPNQVNNVMCFPFLFRGALDVGATTINEEMKVACVKAIAALARSPAPDTVTSAYGGQKLRFGREYILPKPFDPRLLLEIPPAVAQAAMDTGVASRPITDMEEYRESLSHHVIRSANIMKPIFERVRCHPGRIIFAEGEDRRVLQATEQLLEQHIAHPLLVGRRAVIEERLLELGLDLKIDKDITIFDPEDQARFSDNWQAYHALTSRKGVTPAEARTVVRTSSTVLAALKVQQGAADGMICGTVGRFRSHLKQVTNIIGKDQGIGDLSTLSIIIMDAGTFFICDSHVTPDPTADEIAEMAMLSAREVRHFGLTPRVALLSHSSFGSYDTDSSKKMRAALALLQQRAPELEVEGEMQVEVALSERIRQSIYPDSRLTGNANLLVMPNVDAANIACGMLRMVGGGITLGPVLIGTAKPAHIVDQSITVRGLLDMAALTVAQARYQQEKISN